VDAREGEDEIRLRDKLIKRLWICSKGYQGMTIHQVYMIRKRYTIIHCMVYTIAGMVHECKYLQAQRGDSDSFENT
jgi:hypothetical protein